MSQTTEALEETASGPWTDLGLTLPVFITYHLGVVFLHVRNAADWVTLQLIELADNDLRIYGGLTLAIACVYIGILVAAGRGKALHWNRFLWLTLEAVLYAVAMRFAAVYVVGKLSLGPPREFSAFAGLVMSMGAGFYEEVAFRVGLFGLGFKALVVLFPMTDWQRWLVKAGWAVLAAGLFSLWHYIGPFAEPLDARSFVFRWTCGVIFTLIYVFRGFAPAVWTHALYDIWALVL